MAKRFKPNNDGNASSNNKKEPTKSFSNVVRKNKPRKQKRGKEVEMNIPTKSLNSADLKILTSDNHANNDEAWYNKVPELYNDAVSIPFNTTAGLPINPLRTVPRTEFDIGTMGNTRSFPGIAAIYMAPVIGESSSINSPINIAAQNLYVEVTKNNNRDGKYDRTDLMMLMQGADSAYTLYAYLDRCYRAIKNPSTQNRYYPNALLSVLRVDVDNWTLNEVSIRSILNKMAYDLSSINVPDVFSIVSRHTWLFSHVYKDADTEKAQAYVYMPSLFYKWSEGTGDGPNKLEAVAFNTLFGKSNDSQTLTVADVQKAVNAIMRPLLGSSYVALMSSDIARAFPDSRMIKISPIEGQPGLTPVYDQDVLYQISNLTVCPTLLENNVMDITQELSDLVNGPYLKQSLIISNATSNYHIFANKKFVNFRNYPTPKQIAEGTRLIVSTEYDKEAEAYYVTSSGAEIVTGIKIFYYQHSAEYAQGYLDYATFEQTLLMEIPASIDPPDWDQRMQRYLRKIVLASSFDWFPTTYLYIERNGQKPWFQGILQDVDNYVYLSEDQIKLLNNAITISLYAIR